MYIQRSLGSFTAPGERDPVNINIVDLGATPSRANSTTYAQLQCITSADSVLNATCFITSANLMECTDPATRLGSDQRLLPYNAIRGPDGSGLDRNLG